MERGICMKKIFCLVFIVYLLLNLVGCSNVDNEEINISSSPMPSTASKTDEQVIKDTMTEYNVKYFGKDIEYNMSNMLDKEFFIIGTVSLSDYYNYGFSDVEDTSFCIKFKPLYNTSKEEWYIYWDRQSFKEFYDDLIGKDDTLIMAICKIPKLYFNKNQQQMAKGIRAFWE